MLHCTLNHSREESNNYATSIFRVHARSRSAVNSLQQIDIGDVVCSHHSTNHSSCLLLLVVILTLAILHMSTREETHAGTVILLRTVRLTTCSLYFVVLQRRIRTAGFQTAISVPLSVHHS
jgi:hypothetical protein